MVWSTDNVDGVESMLADEDLKQKMQDVGVLAPPEPTRLGELMPAGPG